MYKILDVFPDASTERIWRDMLGKAPLAGHYCGPEFFREPKLRERQTFAILATEDEPAGPTVATGVVTGYLEGHELRCGLQVSPQIAFDDSRPTAEAAASLIDGLLSIARNAHLLTVYTWDKYPVFVARGFREQSDMGTVVVDLSKGPEQVFAGFKAKRAVRAAVRAGVAVREASDEDACEYYQIVAQWSRDKGLPCMSLQYYTQLFRLRENRRLFVAFYDGRMIGGSVIRFLPGGIVEYAANSSLPGFQHLRPNDLLMWTAMEWACRQGYRTFRMAGTHQFLHKFGGSVVPVYRYRMDRTWLRRYDRKEAAVTAAHGLFARLPDAWRNRVKRILKRGYRRPPF